jgi:hypothetical protein
MKENRMAHVRTLQTLTGVGLVLVLLLAMVLATSAQTVILPPAMDETITPPKVNPGDTVQVVMKVENPNPTGRLSASDGTWYKLHLTYVVDPALRIDHADVVPPADMWQVTGNTIRVSINVLAPAASHTVQAGCTALAGTRAGHVVCNEATLEYEDAAGNPQPPIIKRCVFRVVLPIVLRNYVAE